MARGSCWRLGACCSGILSGPNPFPKTYLAQRGHQKTARSRSTSFWTVRVPQTRPLRPGCSSNLGQTAFSARSCARRSLAVANAARA